MSFDSTIFYLTIALVLLILLFEIRRKRRRKNPHCIVQLPTFLGIANGYHSKLVQCYATEHEATAALARLRMYSACERVHFQFYYYRRYSPSNEV